MTRDGVLVPAPDGDGLVTLEGFAILSGLPKSTVTYRYSRLEREGRDPDTMPADDLRSFLTSDDDRRVMLDLEISPGAVWTGGVRQLIRRLDSDHAIECRRIDRIGASAIRARLRRLPGWPRNLAPKQVRWAFGFELE